MFRNNAKAGALEVGQPNAATPPMTTPSKFCERRTRRTHDGEKCGGYDPKSQERPRDSASDEIGATDRGKHNGRRRANDDAMALDDVIDRH